MILDKNLLFTKKLIHKTKIIPIVYDYWISDHLLLGKLVEFMGNLEQIDGCKFDLSNPVISTAMKSRFFLKRYEKEEREASNKYFDSKIPVVELGGCIGVISCIINKKLNKPKQHVVVEANPKLISSIEKNKKLNNSKFEILNKAIGYGKSKITFYLHNKFVGGSIQRKTNQKISIQTINLNTIIKKFKFEKINLICDIEGGEVDIVNYEINILKKYIKYFVVELHPAIVGVIPIKNLQKQLVENNFEKVYFKRQVAVFKNNNLI